MALNPGWQFIDPLGDCIANVVNGELQITVTSTLHDQWTGNFNAPVIIQPCSDTDFDVKIKINSPLTVGYQSVGIHVRTDANNFMRFEVLKRPADIAYFVATFVSGAPTTRLQTAAAITFPHWLRVQRVGNDFTFYSSTNGTSWTTRLTLNYTIAVGFVGVHVINNGTGTGFTAAVDSFVVDDFFGTYLDFFESGTLTEDNNLGKIKTLSMDLTETSTVSEADDLQKLLALSVTLSESAAGTDTNELIKYTPKTMTLSEVIQVLELIGMDKAAIEQLIWKIRGINYRNQNEFSGTPELINPWLPVPPVVDPTEDE